MRLYLNEYVNINDPVNYPAEGEHAASGYAMVCVKMPSFR